MTETDASVAQRQGMFKRILCGKSGIRAGWRLLIFFFLFALFQWGLYRALVEIPSIAPELQAIGKGAFTPWGMFAFEFINVVGAFAAIGTMSVIEHRSLEDYGLRRLKGSGRQFWQGTAWGFGTIIILFVALRAEGVFSFGSLALHGFPLVGYAVVWAAAAVLVGVFEEFVFRGYVQSTLTTAMSFWPAAVISSLIFGLAHISTPGMATTVGLSAAAFGFFFCLTLRRTGALWFAIGMHAAFDYGETFLFSPSGGTNASAHMLNGSLHGPAWLTGGSIGPEASLNGVVVLAILFIVFARVYREPENTTEPQAAAAAR